MQNGGGADEFCRQDRTNIGFFLGGGGMVGGEVFRLRLVLEGGV